MSITSEISAELEKQTMSFLNNISKLAELETKIQYLIYQWNVYEENSFDSVFKEVKETRDALNNQKEFVNGIIKEQQQQLLKMAKDDMTFQELVKESYKILNQVGEVFNGQVSYSITLQSKTTNENITFIMDLKTFLDNVVNITSDRMLLKEKSADSLSKELKSKEGVEIFDWRETKHESSKYYTEMYNTIYWNLYNYALAILITGGDGLNFSTEGNKLESYFHYMYDRQDIGGNAYFTIVEQAKHVHLGRELYNQLKEDMIKSRNKGQNKGDGGAKPFWAGGDVGELQVKGKKAKVAYISTLKRQLIRFAKILSTIKLNALKDKVENYGEDINRFCTEEVKNAVDTLVRIINVKDLNIDDLKKLEAINFNDLL